MSPHILVETNVAYKPFPFEQLAVSNYITKFIMTTEGNEAEKEHFLDVYEMRPFTANVQTIDRTFLDKIFAICDYYEKRESTRYSRHFYDLHMIWTSGLVRPEELKILIPKVIDIRRDGRDTASCQLGYELKKLWAKSFVLISTSKIIIAIQKRFLQRTYRTKKLSIA